MSPVLKKGMRVTHRAKAEWGVGLVLEVKPGGAVTVRFASGVEYSLAQGARFLRPVQTGLLVQKDPARFQKGDRVLHRLFQDWGMGEVLEDSTDEFVKVFWVNEGEKRLKADGDVFERVVGGAAVHPILDNLSYRAIAKGKSIFYSPQRAIAKFLEIFPDGFDDPIYLENERNYKIEAHQLMLELLDEKTLKELLERGEYEEVCSRALRVANKVNLIFPNEKMSLKDGLSGAAQLRIFAEALFQLLYGGDLRKGFSQFAKVLDDVDAAKWTIISYYLFVAKPEKFMFLKPMVTQIAAAMMRFEINYQPQLNWETYDAVLKLSHLLHDKLQEAKLGPRDMIDVQSFMWVIAAY